MNQDPVEFDRPAELSPTPYPTEAERRMAALAHGGTIFAWFLAPLVVYFLERDRSRYVADHAIEALAWSAAGTLLAIVTCGIAVPVFLVFHVVAAIRVLQGEAFTYPIVGPMIQGRRNR